ncbi:hypothetical protein [uncultured Selenomonas sp.]|uniref:hypothetical protein n=1 Tax=uncultured Selenomonas sp. TaxID=159275 RepID=UPI0025D41C51|nr:hypothetical protein [uncultured Selenomonas sp.]
MAGKEMSQRCQVAIDKELSMAIRRASMLIEKITRHIEAQGAERKGDTPYGQGKTGRG